MTPFLDRLLRLWREPLDGRPDPVAEFRALYTDPVPVNGTPMSAAELVARARALQAALADVETEVVHEIAGPDRIVVAFVMRGRHVGPLSTPLGPVPPTGRTVEMRVTDILTLADGRISDVWVISDDLGLLMRLDAVALAG